METQDGAKDVDSYLESLLKFFLADPWRPTEVEHVREMSAKSRHQLKSPPEQEEKSLVKRKYQISLS